MRALTESSKRASAARSFVAALLAASLFLVAMPVHAEEEEDGAAKRAFALAKERPVAVLVAIPAFVITGPFMLVTHWASGGGGDD